LFVLNSRMGGLFTSGFIFHKLGAVNMQPLVKIVRKYKSEQHYSKGSS
jgi:hypothetical protein